MRHLESETILKGGSLNRTTLRRYDDGKSVVRKSISRTSDREYGFVRWYSQLKRLQRYDTIFPGLFPRLIGVGSEKAVAFFDIEYIDGAIDAKCWLSESPSNEDILRFHDGLWCAMDKMHNHSSFNTYDGSLGLYFEEEIIQRLNDASEHESFKRFCENDYIVVDGKQCKSLQQNFDWLRNTFNRIQLNRECYTHGNVTLENILYLPSTGRIIFIDPYEENVIDCREAEYSQILQCSNHCYGFINDHKVTVRDNVVAFEGQVPSAFRWFNERFLIALRERLPPERILTVKLLEASQFTRMLPFKVLAGHLDKAMYFYGVASWLVESIRKEMNS